MQCYIQLAILKMTTEVCNLFNLLNSAFISKTLLAINHWLQSEYKHTFTYSKVVSARRQTPSLFYVLFKLLREVVRVFWQLHVPHFYPAGYCPCLSLLLAEIKHLMQQKHG